MKRFLKLLIITVRKRSLGQDNVFTPVCHSLHRGGFIPACNGGGGGGGQTPPGHTSPRQTPSGQTHPQADTPGQTPPPTRRPLKQAVCILLECILVLNYFQNLLFPSLHFVIRHHAFGATCNVSHKIHRILTSINLSSIVVISLSFVISICNDTEQQ